VLAFGARFFAGGVLGFFYGFGLHDSLTAPAEGGLHSDRAPRAAAHVVEYTVFRDAPPLLGVPSVFDFGRHDTMFLGIIASYALSSPARELHRRLQRTFHDSSRTTRPRPPARSRLAASYLPSSARSLEPRSAAAFGRW
jgi:hypothetical protein